MSKRKQQRRAENRTEGFALEAEIGAECLARGLGVKFSRAECAGTVTPHWIFTTPGGQRQLLHYWPATRRWWRPEDREKGMCREHLEAVELAQFTAKRTPI